MFRDPFGDWDWDFIFQIGLIVGFILGFITMIAATEGNWYDPYMYTYDLILANSTIFIVSVMVSVMALWWYEQFRGGFI